MLTVTARSILRTWGYCSTNTTSRCSHCESSRFRDYSVLRACYENVVSYCCRHHLLDSVGFALHSRDAQFATRRRPRQCRRPAPGAQSGRLLTSTISTSTTSPTRVRRVFQCQSFDADPFACTNANGRGWWQGGIIRSAAAPYVYSARPGMANKPVVNVSWFDAIRFTNWLTNGQGNGDTESGTYLIVGGGPNSGVATVPTAAERAAWVGESLHYLLPKRGRMVQAGLL